MIQIHEPSSLGGQLANVKWRILEQDEKPELSLGMESNDGMVKEQQHPSSPCKLFLYL